MEASMADDQVSTDTAAPADLDPLRIIVQAEEKLMGFRQNLVQQAWDAAMEASESADPDQLDRLIRLHAGIRAIDFAFANRPSLYRMMAPI
jgi:hypothetical protein